MVRTEKETGTICNRHGQSVSMRTCDLIALNCEREGDRESVYTVKLKDEEGKHMTVPLMKTNGNPFKTEHQLR